MSFIFAFFSGAALLNVKLPEIFEVFKNGPIKKVQWVKIACTLVRNPIVLPIFYIF